MNIQVWSSKLWTCRFTQNCSLLFISILHSSLFLYFNSCEFHGAIGLCSECTTHNQFFKGVMFMSLEPIFNLGVSYGMVSSFSLMSIISSLEHFVVVGMVSFLPFIFFIPSPKHVGELSSSSLLLTILFINTSWSISLL